jgi:hypothetical protein
MNDGGYERLHLFDVETSGDRPELRPRMLNRTMPGSAWAYGDGMLFLEQGEGLLVYGIAPAIVNNWQPDGEALAGWRGFSRLEGADRFMPGGDAELEAVSGSSGLKARMRNNRTVIISDASGQPLRQLEAAHPNALVPADIAGIGFSGDESMLALSALHTRGEGDVIFAWQVLSTDLGIALFPLSTQYGDAGGPFMLGDIFDALEPVGWTADDRALVFAEAADLPFSLDDGISGNNWFVRKGAPGGYYQLPLRWSDKPVPGWFLDAVSRLIHHEHNSGLGLEPVKPLGGPLAGELERVLSQLPADPQESEYRDFLAELARSMPKAGASSDP